MLQTLIRALKTYRIVEKIDLMTLSKLFKEKPKHLRVLTHYCIDNLALIAMRGLPQPKKLYLAPSKDRALLDGSIYLLIKLIATVIVDSELRDEILWKHRSPMSFQTPKQPYALCLIDSIMLLLFKPGYTIKHTSKVQEDVTYGLDNNKVWALGLGTMGAV